MTSSSPDFNVIPDFKMTLSPPEVVSAAKQLTEVPLPFQDVPNMDPPPNYQSPAAKATGV